MPEAAAGLSMAPSLLLPADVVTQTIAILAERRAGKSSTGVRLAEQMFLLGLPWVAIDPKGDWWGMRAPGTGPGLKIPVFGGLRGDLPLTPESGRLIAELIVEQNLTCILDVSDFPSDAAQTRFLTDFARHLFALHRKNPSPRHLFLEEADEYIPQVVRSEQAKCVHAWARIVKQGGAFGLGMTLLSQRSAVVNKNVLSQMSTLIAMRTTSSLDRAAIKDWIDYHAGSREIIDTLPALTDGEGWIVSPHWLARHGQPAIQRAQFGARTTFDSGATPTMASGTRPPATLADIDLGALASRMAAVAEQAAADDPAALRARIKKLDRELATAKRGKPDSAENEELRARVATLTAALAELRARPPERIEVPVLTGDDRAAVDRLAEVLALVSAPATAAVPGRPRTGPAAAKPATPARPAAARSEPAAPAPAGEPAPPDAQPGQPRALKAGARSMLEQLARHYPLKMTRRQLAALAGIKGSGSTFSSYFSTLRTNSFVEQEDMFVVITPAGLAAAGAAAETAPPGPEEIRARWRSVLKAGARSMLDHLLERYPEPISRADLAELAGINTTGSTLSSYLSTLRSNHLITEDKTGIRAADVFFLAEADSDA